MLDHKKTKIIPGSSIRGRGLLNNVINKLPFELHLPGYQFCGPGTRLEKRLSKGQSGINPLDAACREHDIAYRDIKDTKKRNQADLKLADAAWQRVKSKDSSLGEKANAWFVTNIMKAKAKLGMGMKNKRSKKVGKKKKQVKKNHLKSRNVLRRMMTNAKSAVNRKRPENLKSAIRIALAEAKKDVTNKHVIKPLTRIIPVPKTGGVIPFLVPLFAGLSALGALSGGAAGIAKAVNEAKQAQKQLSENERHNKTMEAIALGKGLFLKPYRKGLGLYLKPKN